MNLFDFVKEHEDVLTFTYEFIKSHKDCVLNNKTYYDWCELIYGTRTR